jgi:lipid-A-disaccharide synthase
MRIFFSVGEPSGDLHGANLIRALKTKHSDWEFVGYGGPKMASAGCKLHFDLTQLAVMWFAQALASYPKFRRLVTQADEYFRTERPDAVVLIDYPGFNWHIAKKAKAQGIPVIYYGTPQLWAWAGWRVKKMRRNVDHVLCKLPFEETWFRNRGCNATFVGHPYYDELEAQRLDQQFLKTLESDRPLVTILPGSRTQEVKSNLAPFLKAAKLIRKSVPNVRFAVAGFKESQRALARQIIDESGCKAELYIGRTPELIHAAKCCLACSGSVSLELLYRTKPTVILYQISRLAQFAQRFFRKVRYITLVNLLTAEEPFVIEGAPGHYDPADPQDAHVLMPEYLTCEDRTADLAGHIVHWLQSNPAHEENVRGLTELKARTGHGGASLRAAEYIETLIAKPKTTAHAA